MVKTLRYEWSHSRRQFEAPDNISHLMDTGQRAVVSEVLKTVTERSGLKTSDCRVSLCLGLLLFSAAMVGAFMLIREDSDWGRALLLASPFLIFLSVAGRSMARRSGLEAVSRFLELRAASLERRCRQQGLALAYQFVLGGRRRSASRLAARPLVEPGVGPVLRVRVSAGGRLLGVRLRAAAGCGRGRRCEGGLRAQRACGGGPSEPRARESAG